MVTTITVPAIRALKVAMTFRMDSWPFTAEQRIKNLHRLNNDQKFSSEEWMGDIFAACFAKLAIPEQHYEELRAYFIKD